MTTDPVIVPEEHKSPIITPPPSAAPSEPPISPPPPVSPPPAKDPEPAFDDFGPESPQATEPPSNPAADKVAADVHQDVPEVKTIIKDVEKHDVNAIERDIAADAPQAKTQAGDFIALYQEAKSGLKTSEFWLTILGTFLAQIHALSLPGHYGTTITTVGIIASYVLSRGWAKSGVPNEKIARKDEVVK